MRNIKFKAFCKHINKEYDDIDLLYMGKICDVVQLSYGSKGITITVWDRENTAKDVYPGEYELLQFTGLSDKNGKEIYEGDICKISSVDDEGNWGTETTNTEIRYYDGCFKTTYYGFPVSSWAKNNNVDIEVIGNIYENGDLIK